MSFDEIANLTDYQIAHILCRPKGADSNSRTQQPPAVSEDAADADERFRNLWRKRGLAETEIEQRLAAWKEKWR